MSEYTGRIVRMDVGNDDGTGAWFDIRISATEADVRELSPLMLKFVDIICRFPQECEARGYRPAWFNDPRHFRKELERIAMHPACPVAIYNIVADALAWARKLDPSEVP